MNPTFRADPHPAADLHSAVRVSILPGSHPVVTTGREEIGDREPDQHKMMHMEESTQEGRPVSLRFTAGQLSGTQVNLPREGLVIGRDHRCSDLVLTSHRVSRRHVKIQPHPVNQEDLILTDLESTNGTYQWTERVQGPHWVRVFGSVILPRNRNLRIRLGDGVAEFELV